MIRLDINKDLLDLVKGKRVAIVGPAPYLKQSQIGDKIDDYDIVCRINDIIPSEHLRCHYGKRTDIMFHNFGTITIPGLKRKIEKETEAFNKLKMMVCPVIKATHSDTDYLQWPDDHVSGVVANCEEINSNKIPFYWIGVPDYKKLYNEIGVEFNTGMAAIMTLLNYPIRELYVTGFTFYMGGETEDELYYEGHWDEAEAKDKNGKFSIEYGHGLHANIVQIDYFTQLCKKNPLILRTDKEIKDLLSYANSKIEKFVV